MTQEQRAIVDDRGGELLVSAAAGSGKTRVLVSRILDRVEQEKWDRDPYDCMKEAMDWLDNEIRNEETL